MSLSQEDMEIAVIADNLSKKFNVSVQSFGLMPDNAQGQRCAAFTLGADAAAALPMLPKEENGWQLSYRLSSVPGNTTPNPVARVAISCGQTGHQCVCAPSAPKP